MIDEKYLSFINYHLKEDYHLSTINYHLKKT